MTREALLQWAIQRVEEMQKHAEYRAKQVDEQYQRGCGWDFLRARDAANALATAHRTAWCVERAWFYGDWSLLFAEYERANRVTDRRRAESCGINREEAPVASGAQGQVSDRV